MWTLVVNFPNFFAKKFEKLKSPSVCVPDNSVETFGVSFFWGWGGGWGLPPRRLYGHWSYSLSSLKIFLVLSSQIHPEHSSISSCSKKNMMISTNGDGSMKGSVRDIFSSKQMENLVEFKQEIPDYDAMTDFSLKPEDMKYSIKWELLCSTVMPHV